MCHGLKDTALVLVARLLKLVFLNTRGKQINETA